MSLHFIFGRAGTGKTTRCCADIARYMEEEPGRTAFFIVPDQATYRAESMLAAAFPGGGFADVTVCGFARLSYRVFQELHEDASEALSPLVQQLILRRLLTAHAGEFRMIREAARQPHFAGTLTAFFHQLDSFQVREPDLKPLPGRRATRRWGGSSPTCPFSSRPTTPISGTISATAATSTTSSPRISRNRNSSAGPPYGSTASTA